MSDPSFNGALRRAYAELQKTRQYTMMGWPMGDVTPTDTKLALEDIGATLRILNFAYRRQNTVSGTGDTTVAGREIQDIVSKLRIAEDKLKRNDWKGVPRLLTLASRQIRALADDTSTWKAITMKSTSSLPQKVEEATSYLRPIVTFLGDGKRGAHVVVQDATRSIDVWNDVRTLFQENGNAKGVKYADRILGIVAHAKYAAQQAMRGVPGSEQSDNALMRAAISDVTRAQNIARVLARMAVAGKSYRARKAGEIGYPDARAHLRMLVSNAREALDAGNRARALKNVKEAMAYIRSEDLPYRDTLKLLNGANNMLVGNAASPDKANIIASSYLRKAAATMPDRSAGKTVKGVAQNRFIYTELASAKDTLSNFTSVLMNPSPANWQLAQGFFAKAIGKLVRIQRMISNDSRRAHDSSLLREAIDSLARANYIISLGNVDDKRSRSEVVQLVGRAVSMLNALTT